MKKLIVILLALAMGAAAHAQGVWVDESIAIGYNRSFKLYEDDATMLGWDGKHLQLRGGVGMHSYYWAGELGVKKTFNLRRGVAGVEGIGLAKRSKEFKIREHNLCVLGFWNMQDRVEVKAGTFFKWLRPIKGDDVVFEPLNFAYSVSFTALPTDRQFNFGLTVSNLDYFTAERFYCPMMTLKLTYRMSSGYLLYLKIREHNSGIFDLSSNRFDCQVRGGTIITW